MPLVDGGSKITNYIIEKRESTRKAYATAITQCDKCSVTIPNLAEGSEYYFRVSAENEFGIGEAIETPDPIRASQAPSPPESITVTDVTKNSASLAWTKPKHDGGSRITGYVIEAQKKGTDQWSHVTTVKTFDFTIKNLNENEEYIFRVMAANLSGRSSPRQSKSTIIKEQNTEPEFDLRAVCQKTVIAKAGDDIKVEVPISGRPKPTVSWQRDNQALKLTQRTNVENTPTSTILKITECVRNDSGIYSVTGKNVVGSVTENITIKVHDVPGPPKGPIKLDKVAPTFIEISWDTPENNGGVPINNYIVEIRETTSQTWVELSTSVIRTTFKSSITIAWNKPVYDGGSEITGYIIEVCPLEEEEWAIVSPKEGLKATSFTITNLKENQEYKINISAVNSEGVGEAAAVPGSPKAEDRLLPPEMDLDADLRKVVCLRACNTLRLFVPIRGRPVPEIKWTRENDEPLERATIENTSSYTLLVIGNVNRSDSGKYILSLENSSGTKTSEAVLIKDPFIPPDAPKGVDVSNIKKDSMVITWEPPTNDGGSPVTGYIIEKHDKEGVRWTRCNRSTVTDVTYKVKGLLEGHAYEFRVAAENAVGTGEPSSPSVYFKAFDPVFRPGPPSNPKVTDMNKTSVMLAWGKPIFDGASEIQGYIVEACEAKISEDEKKTYKFRICAINKVGVGEHVDVPGPITPEDKTEEPDLDIDPELQKVVSIKAGASLRVFIPIKGRPSPAITWAKDEGPLKETAQTEVTSTYTSLVIDSVTRLDSGKYTVTAENSTGTKSAVIVVRVLDTPSAPINLKVQEITKESVTLSWEPPLMDGGAHVKNYIIEKRESTRKTYSAVVTNCHKLSWKIEPLQEGCNYYFRVLAENMHGIGLPAETVDPLKVSEVPQTPGKITVVDVTKLMFNTYSVKSGNDFKLEIPVFGRPKPKVTWAKDGQSLKISSRVNISNTPTSTTLQITEASKDDFGKYSVTATSTSVIGYHLENKERTS
uniref:Titin n=1 Tax=Denticeps clupeoides TaxID=299321 RepID=A0AAY4B930_9TELE